MTSQFIFIGGLQRSGTTVLGRLLAQHSEMTGMTGTPTREDEGQFVQDVYLTDHEMGRQMHREIFTGSGRIVRWAYHPQAHLVEEDARSIPGAGRRLRASWSGYWEKPDAAVLIEKSPSNLMRTRFLQELFSGAGFIIITRHPLMQALAVRKWAMYRTRVGFSLSLLIDHWLTAMECFASDQPSLERSLIVKYEDLTAAPTETLTVCQRFIGVPVEHLSTSAITNRNSRYAAYWSAFTGGGAHLPNLEDAPLSRVSRPLEHAVARLFGKKIARDIVAQYGERVRNFGYDLDTLPVH